MIDMIGVTCILDALENNPKPFRTLENVVVERDEMGEIMFVSQNDTVLINVLHNGRPRIFKFALGKKSLESSMRDLLGVEDCMVDVWLHRAELAVVSSQGEENYFDLIDIDNEPVELLSLVVPNNPVHPLNKDIIIMFTKFLICLCKDRVIVNHFSHDDCVVHNGRVLLTPIYDIEVKHVPDFDSELIVAFKNFTVNMILGLELEIGSDHRNYLHEEFDVRNTAYYASEKFTNILMSRLEIMRSAMQHPFRRLEELIFASNYAEVLGLLRAFINVIREYPKVTGADSGLIEISDKYGENRVAVMNEVTHKWGYTDLKGNLIIPQIYDSATEFYENVAIVKKDHLFGAIDRDGNQLLDLKYKWLFWDGRNNSFVFCVTKLFGLLDRLGRVVLDEKYLSIFDLNDGCAVVQSPKTKLYGAINFRGEEIIKPVYDHIEPFNEMKTVATKGKKKYTFDILGELLKDEK